MTKFIILTDKINGTKLYVNPSAIQLISENQNFAMLHLYGSQYSYIEVSESPESIMNLIRITEEDDGLN